MHFSLVHFTANGLLLRSTWAEDSCHKFSAQGVTGRLFQGIIEQRRKGIIQVISGKEKQGDATVSIVIFLCVHLAFHYSSLTKQRMKIAVIC